MQTTLKNQFDYNKILNIVYSKQKWKELKLAHLEY